MIQPIQDLSFVYRELRRNELVWYGARDAKQYALEKKFGELFGGLFKFNPEHRWRAPTPPTSLVRTP